MITVTVSIKSPKHLYIAVAKIPGTYLNTEMNKEVFNKFWGSISELLTLTVPKLFRKNTVLENSKKAST